MSLYLYDAQLLVLVFMRRIFTHKTFSHLHFLYMCIRSKFFLLFFSVLFFFILVICSSSFLEDTFSANLQLFYYSFYRCVCM